MTKIYISNKNDLEGLIILDDDRMRVDEFSINEKFQYLFADNSYNSVINFLKTRIPIIRNRRFKIRNENNINTIKKLIKINNGRKITDKISVRIV